MDDFLFIVKYLEELYLNFLIKSKSKEVIVVGSNIFYKFCVFVKNKDLIKDVYFKFVLLKKMEELELFL